MADTALKTFSLMNAISEISAQDAIYKFDPEENRRVLDAEPWKKDPHFFKTCKISAIALIKMAIHARSGVPHEIMGLMQGKVVGNAIVIMDAFALPVQGTETRVNAANEANEYMVEYSEQSEKAKRYEKPIGWYHSHPGYGCWLSGIDVNTQMDNQKYFDPFIAVVIDPNRTISAGKVDIGAFRTYPADYKPPNAGSSEYQSIPLEKIEDFGVHANSYYPVEVEIFKSTLDNEILALLWNKYWVNTLSQSPLISNRAYAASQLADLHQKLSKAQGTIANTKAVVPTLNDKDQKEGNGNNGASSAASAGVGKDKKKQEENLLSKNVRDSSRLAIEAQHGLIAQVIKDIVFSIKPNEINGTNGNGAKAVGDIVDVTMD